MVSSEAKVIAKRSMAMLLNSPGAGTDQRL